MANLLKRYEAESYPGQFHVVCEDDVECSSAYGWGHTLEQARTAWGEALLERVDDVIFDLAASGAISREIAQECFISIDGLTFCNGILSSDGICHTCGRWQHTGPVQPGWSEAHRKASALK